MHSPSRGSKRSTTPRAPSPAAESTLQPFPEGGSGVSPGSEQQGPGPRTNPMPRRRQERWEGRGAPRQAAPGSGPGPATPRPCQAASIFRLPGRASGARRALVAPTRAGAAPLPSPDGAGQGSAAGGPVPANSAPILSSHPSPRSVPPLPAGGVPGEGHAVAPHRLRGLHFPPATLLPLKTCLPRASFLEMDPTGRQGAAADRQRVPPGKKGGPRHQGAAPGLP